MRGKTGRKKEDNWQASQNLAKDQGIECGSPLSSIGHPPVALYVWHENTFCFFWRGHSCDSPVSLLTDRSGPPGKAAGVRGVLYSLPPGREQLSQALPRAPRTCCDPRRVCIPGGARHFIMSFFLHFKKSHRENGNCRSSFPLFEWVLYQKQYFIRAVLP